jgi:ABC-type multidrug transport system fused ATPase/permease subunit
VASQRLRRFNLKHAAAAAGTVPVTQLIVAMAIAAIIYFAAGQAFAGSTNVGGFVEFIAATGMLLQPLKRLTGINEHIQKGLAASESVFGLIDETPEDDHGTVELERAPRRHPHRQGDARLPLGFPPGAGRRVARDPAGGDRGARRALGQRQVVVDPPAAALLSPLLRADHGRRP